MSEDTYNVVVGGEPGEYVELSAESRASKVKGRLFKKQILHFGSFQHPKVPGKKVTIDKAFADKMVKNFNDGVCDIVQVPMVDGANRHVEDPERNIGRVVDVDYDDKGIYAYVDARKETAAAELGKTLIGASAMMSMNYKNNLTGDMVGPTLLHVAVTNRPYITNLSDFEEEISASADTTVEETVLLSEDSLAEDAPEESESDEAIETVSLGAAETEEKTMPKTKEELLAELLAEHDVDVAALQAKVAENEAALSSVSDATDAEGELSLSDIANAMIELSNTNDALTASLAEQAAALADIQADRDALALSAAESEIDTLVKAGRVLPKQRDKMLELSMKDRETFDAILPDEAIVSLSEEGVTSHEDTRSTDDQDKQTEIARLVALVKNR